VREIYKIVGPPDPEIRKMTERLREGLEKRGWEVFLIYWWHESSDVWVHRDGIFARIAVITLGYFIEEIMEKPEVLFKRHEPWIRIILVYDRGTHGRGWRTYLPEECAEGLERFVGEIRKLKAPDWVIIIWDFRDLIEFVYNPVLMKLLFKGIFKVGRVIEQWEVYRYMRELLPR